MRALVAGLSKTNSDTYVKLIEPVIFQLRQNLKSRIVIGETMEEMRPLLRALKDLSDAGNPSIGVLLQILAATPKSHHRVGSIESDIDITNDSEVEEKLTGENFEWIIENIIQPILPGITREEAFNDRLRRLAKTAGSITILDQYLSTSMCEVDYKDSGAYWLLHKFAECRVPTLQILSNKRVSGKDIDQKVFRERIWEFVNSPGVNIGVTTRLGHVSHDRHLTFHYSNSNFSHSISLGKGADTFRFPTFRDGQVIENYSSDTAQANEKNVISKNSLHFYISTRPHIVQGQKIPTA